MDVYINWESRTNRKFNMIHIRGGDKWNILSTMKR